MTTTIDVSNVRIDEPEKRPVVRDPVDLLRLVVGITATIVGFLLATMLNNLSEAITVEVIEGFDSFPPAVVVVLILAVSFLGVFLPFFAFGYLIKRRWWGRLGVAILATIIAIAGLTLIDDFLVSQFADPNLQFNPPSWVCDPTVDYQLTLDCIPGDSAGVSGLLAITGLVAYVSTMTPVMNRRWRRFAWGAPSSWPRSGCSAPSPRRSACSWRSASRTRSASPFVPTFFLYRIATFWMPICPGVWAVGKLERDGML